jgi:cyanophycinase
MGSKRDRCLFIIGGHEDKQNNKTILKAFAERVGAGKLVLTAVASKEPHLYYEEYVRVLRACGIKHVHRLEINSREEAKKEGNIKILEDATAVFFTGGDQLKITSQIGDTPIFERLHQIYEEGGVLAGTSAGAAAMCETMLVSGESEQSNRIADLRMATGLGMIKGLVIDTHFAERGRLGRILGAVAQNPYNLGIGIDEDTCVMVEGDKKFTVLGSGAVYVADGTGITTSNLTEQANGKVLSICHLKLHVLSQGDQFYLQTREPKLLSDSEGLARTAQQRNAA